MHVIDPTAKKKSGQPKIYGEKYNTKNIPDEFLVEESQDDKFIKKIYQFQALNKSIQKQILNIVIVHTYRKTDNKLSVNIWFSNDLLLSAKTLLDYYALRFQIEFEFRDAKQHFGLSDFKNYTAQNLTNFVNLSFFMCLISKVILARQRVLRNIPKFSIIDLKTLFYQRFVAKNVYKLLHNQAISISFEQLIELLSPDDFVNAA